MTELKCVNCHNYLFTGPYQCSCGDRLCADCFQGFRSEKKVTLVCPKCGENISLDECFKDRAAENELQTATIKCINQDCPWEGPGKLYKGHIDSCNFTRRPCPNSVYGCTKLLLPNQVQEHLERECQFTPVQSPQCSNKDVYGDLTEYPQQDIQQTQEGLTTENLKRVIEYYLSEWEIPEVQRRRGEARSGRTVSLYSAPFYTGRHGYKMCLRLYMDGDGSGKGTHLSFFLTLMRGEYDALLTWPFNQVFQLIFVNQENQGGDIVHTFKPDPASPSFKKPHPHSEMNVASGCPKFAPISILDNPAYTKNDTMILRCKIFPLL